MECQSWRNYTNNIFGLIENLADEKKTWCKWLQQITHNHRIYLHCNCCPMRSEVVVIRLLNNSFNKTPKMLNVRIHWLACHIKNVVCTRLTHSHKFHYFAPKKMKILLIFFTFVFVGQIETNCTAELFRRKHFLHECSANLYKFFLRK